jgi:hypothetical protein
MFAQGTIDSCARVSFSTVVNSHRQSSSTLGARHRDGRERAFRDGHAGIARIPSGLLVRAAGAAKPRLAHMDRIASRMRGRHDEAIISGRISARTSIEQSRSLRSQRLRPSESIRFGQRSDCIRDSGCPAHLDGVINGLGSRLGHRKHYRHTNPFNYQELGKQVTAAVV